MSQQVELYRLLLKTVRSVFKGDGPMQQRAKQEIRLRYKESAGATDQAVVDKLLADGRDAADFLRSCVVQAKVNERGNYAIKIEPHHIGSVAEEGHLPPGQQ